MLGDNGEGVGRAAITPSRSAERYAINYGDLVVAEISFDISTVQVIISG